MHGRFNTEDIGKLGLFVKVCPRTMTVWHSLEEVVERGAVEKFEGDRDLEVWIGFATGIRGEDEPPAVGRDFGNRMD